MCQLWLSKFGDGRDNFPGHGQATHSLVPSDVVVHQPQELRQRHRTPAGAETGEHLDYYLDEFTFRYNRRNSRSRGKLFLRLDEQAVAVGPAPYKSMVKCFAKPDGADHNMYGLPE